MNLETSSLKKNNLPKIADDSFDDFDFKPLTSGLGFHQPQKNEVKPATFTERVVKANSPVMHTPMKNDSSVYQNDLSLFYGNQSLSEVKQPETEEKKEVIYRNASKAQRVFAYAMDLALILSILGVVLTVMARTISMDLMEVWTAYPNEITPLVVILFCGFYLIYFSIFEKARQSTLGKNLMGIRVVNSYNKIQDFHLLLLRSLISLTNFVSLGLFSYFDLQNKVTNSKVIKVD